MDVAAISRAVLHYYQRGLASGTQQTYQAGLYKYITFCKLINHTAIPTAESTLLLFVAYLGQQGLMHTTIKAYLAAIRSLHVASGNHQAFYTQLTPCLQQVLKAIKKEQASHQPTVRLPITISVMRQIKAVITTQPWKYHTTMMLAACCVAFFGFLHCSEFTSPGLSQYDPTTHLSFSDLAIYNRSAPSLIQITIKESKTDPFRRGTQVFLGKTDTAICPVEAIIKYLTFCGTNPGPLFIRPNLEPLTRQFFATSLTSLLKDAGLHVPHYNTHSFQIGAATTAMSAGISDVHVKMLGRWKSKAYQSYVRTPPSELASFSKILASRG